MRSRILVVDDKESMLGMLRDVLQESFEVTTENDGQRAIALATAGDFDVVLADIRMPGADGFEVLRAVKQARPDVAREMISRAALPSLIAPWYGPTQVST